MKVGKYLMESKMLVASFQFPDIPFMTIKNINKQTSQKRFFNK